MFCQEPCEDENVGLKRKCSMEVHALCGCLTGMCGFSALQWKECLVQSLLHCAFRPAVGLGKNKALSYYFKSWAISRFCVAIRAGNR